jgi:hypothetical protein
MMSVYLGNVTIVLKLPLTRAASAKGLQRYNGFDADPSPLVSVIEFLRDNEPEGVGDRLLGLGVLLLLRAFRTKEIEDHPKDVLENRGHGERV